jgi:hypothetical protein
VDPCLNSKQYKLQENDSTKSAVDCRFPPSDKLNVQWTESKVAADEKSEEKAEVSSTVEQKTLFSIGEGIISIQCLLNYTITSGQISYFEVEIDDRIKVLHVDGLKHIPVKRWEVVKAKKKKKKKEDTSGESKSVLKLWLEYGLEDMYEFSIFSELAMKEMASQVEMPRFNSVTSKEIARETGFVAVETRTNVEVNEIKCDGIAMVDIREVPAKLNTMAVNPLLLGYKFVAPEYTLELDIKKHQDVEVLIAVIDSAFFTATYSDEGLAMFRMVLLVRNTQKQYIRITLPGECEIWSTLVAGAAVKPALDENGKVMIPLQKSSKSDSKDSHSAFQVEFIYLVKSPAMSRRSNLSITFPYCDIPINQLFVNVFLPENFRYGEFEGMREVSYWSKSLPSAPSSSVSSGLAKQKEQNNFRFELSKNAKSYKQDDGKSKGGRVTGVLPVKIDMPQVGRQFLFEQLGASSSDFIVLTVAYRREDKGCCAKRSDSSCCC